MAEFLIVSLFCWQLETGETVCNDGDKLYYQWSTEHYDHYSDSDGNLQTCWTDQLNNYICP